MIRLAGVAALVALLAAGATAAAQAPTKRPGTLTVGLNLPATGFAVGSVKGDEIVFARGFEVDLAKALKARLRLARVNFVNVADRSRFFAAGRKRFDLGLARLIVQAPERRVDTSDAVLPADLAVLLATGVPPIKAVADLRALTLCVTKSGLGPSVARKRIRPTSPVVAVVGDNRLLDALEERRCDAVLREAPLLAAALAARDRRAFGAVTGRIATGAVMVATLDRRSLLTPAVNRALAGLRRNGTIGRLARRWLAFDPARVRLLR